MSVELERRHAVPPAEPPVIVTEALTKSYDGFEAVRGIDLQVVAGEIFGLIGPDGAGKTSIFHILGGVMEASGGRVEVLGRQPRLARTDMGYLTQRFSLYPDLSVEENLRYAAALRRVPDGVFRERQDELLKLMDLYRFSGRLASQLSGGMKQKLALCSALIARPKLLLLDEPTTGVDPVSRREFWDVLASISQEGVTIVVATPYLDEAERCHRVALMYEGQIRRLGSPPDLRHELGLTRIEVRGDKLDRLEECIRAGAEDSDVTDLQAFGDRLDVLTQDVPQASRAIEACATRLSTSVETDTQDPTLENVFVRTLRGTIGDTVSASFRFTRDGLPPKAGPAIEAQRLSKSFGDFRAVEDVSLTVEYGQIYGLLGANGAGKTTTIKMLCGLLPATRGSMRLCGESSDLRSSKLRSRLGYMSQKFTLYDDLTVIENLKFYCGVYEIPASLRSERIQWVLQSCELSGNEKLITGKLPGGWKQRLAFGACVMHEPEVLFLDEPTSGVDPLARRQLWKMIRDFARSGTAVLVTTHFLEESEHCHKLGFMVAGQIVAQGSPGRIKSSQPGMLMELKTSDNQTASRLLKERFDEWRVSIFADSIHLVVESDADLNAAGTILADSGIAIKAERRIPFSMEDSFIGIVKRAEGEQ